MESEYNYINLKYLNDISPAKEFKLKIFSMFKNEIQLIETEMKRLLVEKNYTKLAEIAHKAKSNVSILGMLKQSNDMEELENDIKENKHMINIENRVKFFLIDIRRALDEIEEIENSL